MNLLPKYISRAEVEKNCSPLLNKGIQDLLAKNFPQVESQLIDSIAEKESKIILKSLTEAIEEIIDNKINNSRSRKVGW
ncbi:MAG: hypothetical protein QNJ42_25305 [Crocosphaera sp.]|nr:hypothetical protein [Crocosphaera sp.]